MSGWSECGSLREGAPDDPATLCIETAWNFGLLAASTCANAIWSASIPYLIYEAAAEGQAARRAAEQPKCPENIQAFFNDFWQEFVDLAAAVGTVPENFAAFAALESDWGNASHRENHNLFSELTNKSGSWQMIHWNSFANEARYVKKRLSKPYDQEGEQGIIDPGTFVDQLSNIGWTADPPAAYKNSFFARFAQVVYWEPICLH